MKLVCVSCPMYNFHNRYFTSRVANINACAANPHTTNKKSVNKKYFEFFISLISFKVIWRSRDFDSLASLHFAQTSDEDSAMTCVVWTIV